MTQIDSPSLETLPAPRLRQGVLRRAQLTLSEARALLELLDQLDHGQGPDRARIQPLRNAFGLQLLDPGKQSRTF